MRIGQTPIYPSYFETSYPNRRIAVLSGRYLYIEDMGRLTIHSFAHLLDSLFRYNLITFTESLTERDSFPYLNSFVHYDKSDVIASQTAKPLSIKVSGPKSTSRWITPAITWDRVIDSYFIEEMRAIFRFFHMVKPTPGSLGGGLMRCSFYELHLPRHTAANVVACQFLRRHGHGGRCDTLVDPDTFYPQLLEVDMADAYLAHAMELPCGTSYWFNDGHTSPFVTYFAQCTVRIPHHLVLGPFPVRTGKKNVKLSYPTLPGTYTAYLWKEQVQDAEAAGCVVHVGHGVGWKYFTNDTRAFCRYMHLARKALDGTPIERDAKKIAVSGLGQLGMDNEFYRLVSDDNGTDPCLITDKGAKPLDYYVRSYNDYKRPDMVHWFNYFIMQCARSLYRHALPFALQDRLIMTNYDALLIVEKDERQRYARKYSLDALMCDAGDLRWQELTNVTILGDRSLKCDQKVITPGVSHEPEEIPA